MVNTTVPVIRGREKHPDLPYKQSDYDGHTAAHDLGSQYGGDAVALCNGLHTGHIGKADAHDDRQGGADVESALAAQREKLEQGGDCGHKKSSLDEDHLVSLRHASAADGS